MYKNIHHLDLTAKHFIDYYRSGYRWYATRLGEMNAIAKTRNGAEYYLKHEGHDPYADDSTVCAIKDAIFERIFGINCPSIVSEIEMTGALAGFTAEDFVLLGRLIRASSGYKKSIEARAKTYRVVDDRLGNDSGPYSEKEIFSACRELNAEIRRNRSEHTPLKPIVRDGDIFDLGANAILAIETTKEEV